MEPLLPQTKSQIIRKRQIMPISGKKCYFLLGILLILSGLLYATDLNMITQYTYLTQLTENDEDINDPIPSPGYLVNNEGCRMPSMEPFSAMVQPFLQNITLLDCTKKGSKPIRIESDDNTVYLSPIADDKTGNLTSELICCYEQFERETEESEMSDRSAKFHETCILFENSTDVGDVEFIKVICKNDKKQEILDYHSFVPLKPEVEQRCSKGDETANERVSVLILGIDAVSRLNFYRTMPRTVKALEELGGIEMLGYNKVGDNTFPNLIPILTGMNVNELKKECWPTSDSYFDPCPFIWKKYKGAGYRTIFAEDASWMGVFQYQKNGFKFQPTDYYWHTFSSVSENDIGHDKPMNADMCVGPRLTPLNLLSYANKVVNRFYDKRYFGLIWETSISHDDVNYPQMIDKYYENFIRELYKKKLMNSTVLVVLSDHGIRWGSLRNTYQGMVEERLPMLNVVLPKWFSEKYPTATANLRRNRRSLTTPFDFYETLKDLVHANELTNDKIRSRTAKLKEETPRGISLFLRVPSSRTCNSSGIEPHWCTCHDSGPVDIKSEAIQIVADFIVKSLNNLLLPYRSCANLTLDAIMEASAAGSPGHLLVNSPTILDYTVALRTKPGLAFFEATVRDNNGTLSLTGPISRTNMYHDQSHCVHDYRMKLYCYCI